MKTVQTKTLKLNHTQFLQNPYGGGGGEMLEIKLI